MASESLVENKPEDVAAAEKEQEVVEEATPTPEKGKRARKVKGSSAGKDSPVTPASERPTRERKVVERYSVPDSGRSPAPKSVSIEKGRGTALRDIPNVAYKLSKRKLDDKLQLLHSILFGKKGKSHNVKRNILQFSGFVWAENEELKQRTKIREKLDKCVKEKLMDFCDLLNIQNKAGSKKEELSAKLLEFLESPHATTDVLLSEKEQKGQKRKKKVTPSKNAGSGEGSPETPAKKQKNTTSAEKDEESTKDEQDEQDDTVGPSDPKDEDHEEDDDGTLKGESDHGEKSVDKEDKPKYSSKYVKESTKVKAVGKSTPAKKTTPAKAHTDTEKKPRSSKRGATDDDDGASASRPKRTVKKPKAADESPIDSKGKSTGKKQPNKSPTKDLAKDQVKGKKAKPEPTREDVHAVVVDILKEVDFNTATLSDILKQLGAHFKVDLMHRKAEVKEIITDVINNMTDEEDEDEEQEAAGDDSEKEQDDA